MTSKEAKAAEATACILALIVVVYVLPALILGGWWVYVSLIASVAVGLISIIAYVIWLLVLDAIT